MKPSFTHEELCQLWDAITAHAENWDSEAEPPAAAQSALEKLDRYIAEQADKRAKP